MTRTMDAAAVREIRAEMDKAKTSIKSRISFAHTALRRGDVRGNLTESGRAEWLKELAEQTARATQKSTR